MELQPPGQSFPIWDVTLELLEKKTNQHFKRADGNPGLRFLKLVRRDPMLGARELVFSPQPRLAPGVDKRQTRSSKKSLITQIEENTDN